MIGRSQLAAGVAVLASLAIHVALLARIVPDAEGTGTPAGVTQVSMLGQSFEDLAAGQLTPAPPGAEGRAAVTPAVSATPVTAAQAAPVREAEATPAAPARDPVSVTPAVVPRPATPTATAPVLDRITAQDPATARTPTDATPRPQARPPRPEPATPTATATPPQGNAARSATAGTSTGRADGIDSRPQGDAQAAPGHSARDIARYPQRVNRHLSRLRRPNSRFDGSAVVGFTIAPSGGLASLGILRSSGDAAFDDRALRHVRGAAPFPAPPAGAQTRFSVTVRGR